MNDFIDLKEISYKANIDLNKKGLVTHTFGNVSVIDRDKNVIAIKPSGVEYDKLDVDDIVIVDLSNKIIEGELKPSSDTKTHTMLYKSFPKIGSVVHTHSQFAVAWAQAKKQIPILGTTHADLLPFEIPVTGVMTDEMIKGDYETETGIQIKNVFENLSYEEIEMVLVACHGPFTWGKDAEKAIFNAYMLEQIAKIAFLTIQINPDIENIKESLIKKHYERKHGKDSYYGQA